MTCPFCKQDAGDSPMKHMKTCQQKESREWDKRFQDAKEKQDVSEMALRMSSS